MGEEFVPNGNGKPFHNKPFKVTSIEMEDGQVYMIYSDDGSWLSPLELEKDYRRMNPEKPQVLMKIEPVRKNGFS